MAALRGVGERLDELDGVPGLGRAVDSGGREGRSAGPVWVTGEVFSKLRAEGLTTGVAASLLSCAPALSFFAPACGTFVLGWGARVVMKTKSEKVFYLQYVQLAETGSAISLA
jgi:hypothetical protein